MEKNLTDGGVFKTIVVFSAPYLLSYFLQTFYGLADLYIVGFFDGVASVDAVAIGGQIMHMLTVATVGLAMGSTVVVGRAVGAGRKEEAAGAVGNTASLFAVLSLAAAVVLLLARKRVVELMLTPARAVPGATEYLTVCFLGIPFITAYNVIASVLRGTGDSKTPLYFIAFACAANVVLDCAFVGAARMGPAGAALGTVLSQAAAAFAALAVVIKKRVFKTTKRDFRLSGPVVKELLKTGLPVAAQDGFIQISFLIITAIANARGFTDSAAVGIVEKFIGILFLVPSSMLAATSVICAQNFGARRPDRAKRTLLYAVEIAAGIGLASATAVSLAAEPTVGLFVGGDAPDVIRSGAQYLRGYVWDCVLAGVHFGFSGYFCALRKSGLSFLHNFISIVFARIPLAWLASRAFPDNLTPMGLATTAGSGLSVAVCVIAYLCLERRDRSSASAPQGTHDM